MVVIRLARCGAKHSPKYRIAVADSRKAATGKYIEILGQFNPSPRGKETGLNIDMDKVQDWINKGAQLSSRVKSLLRKAESSKQ